MLKSVVEMFGLPVVCAIVGAFMMLTMVLLPLAAVIYGSEDEAVILIGLFITKILGAPWSFLLPIKVWNNDVNMLLFKAAVGVVINGAILGGLAGVFFAFLTPYDAVGNDIEEADKNPYQFDA